MLHRPFTRAQILHNLLHEARVFLVELHKVTKLLNGNLLRVSILNATEQSLLAQPFVLVVELEEEAKIL
jgi:hypothetical protein